MIARIAAAAVFAFLAGFILGGWGPKTDLDRLRKERDELRKKLDTQKPQIRELVSILQLPSPDDGRRPSPAPVSGRSRGEPAPAPTGTVALAAQDVPQHAGDTNRVRRSMADQIEAASAAWKVRAELARNSFLQNVKPGETQVGQFDALVGAMNEDLAATIEDWSAFLKEQEVTTPEHFLRMMNDLSEVVVIAYDAMDASMPPDWRDKAGKDLELLSFIDPKVAKPLAGVEGKLGPGRHGRGPAWQRSDEGGAVDVR